MELRQAILGLLSVRPMSGYDLGRAFAGSVAHFWYADQSQIYRVLDRLARDGAIATERIRQETQPDRKVHSLTDIGRDELDAWLTSPLEQDKTKDPFLARLFFGHPLGPEGVAGLLDAREREVSAKAEQLRAIDAPEDAWADTLRAATLRYGLAQAEAELVWIDQTRRRIDEWRDKG